MNVDIILVPLKVAFSKFYRIKYKNSCSGRFVESSIRNLNAAHESYQSMGKVFNEHSSFQFLRMSQSKYLPSKYTASRKKVPSPKVFPNILLISRINFLSYIWSRVADFPVDIVLDNDMTLKEDARKWYDSMIHFGYLEPQIRVECSVCVTGSGPAPLLSAATWPHPRHSV